MKSLIKILIKKNSAASFIYFELNFSSKRIYLISIMNNINKNAGKNLTDISKNSMYVKLFNKIKAELYFIL